MEKDSGNLATAAILPNRVIMLIIGLFSAFVQATIPEYDQVDGWDRKDVNLPVHTLLGYDCTEPRGVQDIGHDDDDPCAITLPNLQTKNVTYQLVQREKWTRYSGHACILQETRTVSYCGVYDHQTRDPAKEYQTRPTRMTYPECDRVINTNLFRDPTGVTHDITLNQWQDWTYEQVGHTYYEDEQLRCVGGVFEGKDGYVVTIQQRFILKTEEFIGNQEHVSVKSLGINVPGSIRAGRLETDEGTFIWNKSREMDCPLALNKEFRGIEVTDPNGKVVVMSTDGNLVRVIRTDAVTMCDKIVYATNYPDLFLHPAGGRTPITRRVHPDEISITMYINNRDDFLYNHLLEAVRDEFQRILLNDCHQKKEATQLRTWLQHADPQLATWTLGGGTFATAAGEVLYTYSCRPILVKAVSADRCFQSLPVRPLNVYDSSTDIWFLEPLTHRLTKQGVPAPCSPRFAPKYRDYKGSWLVATPQIHDTTAPTAPSKLPGRNLELRAQLDWSRGGIYGQEELREMETYLEFSRRREVLTSKLTEQAHFDIRQPVRVNSIFPGVTLLDPSFMHRLWTRILGFLHTWGEGAAIFLSSYLIVRLIWSIGTWFHRTVVLYRLHGCALTTFLYSICDQCLVLKSYQQQHQRAADAGEDPSPVITTPVEKPTTKANPWTDDTPLAQVTAPSWTWARTTGRQWSTTGIPGFGNLNRMGSEQETHVSPTDRTVGTS